MLNLLKLSFMAYCENASFMLYICTIIAHSMYIATNVTDGTGVNGQGQTYLEFILRFIT